MLLENVASEIVTVPPVTLIAPPVAAVFMLPAWPKVFVLWKVTVPPEILTAPPFEFAVLLVNLFSLEKSTVPPVI